MNQEKEKLSSPWLSWIVRNTKEIIVTDTNYDKLCELAVSTYQLNNRNRDPNRLDLITFFLIWWDKNKRFMKKYNSLKSIGEHLGGRSHRTVLFHLNAFSDQYEGRKVSSYYKQNVECIRDFLES